MIQMDYLLINLKIILAMFILVILPGMLLMSLLKIRARIPNIDSYEMTSLGLVAGLALWLPISLISYRFDVSINSPIYISVFITSILLLSVVVKDKVKLKDLVSLKPYKYFYGFFNVYTIAIIIISILVGYASQYQAGNVDALVHLAAIRNIATFEIVQSCDWILGNGTPVQNVYGCHPWYLTLGMVVKLFNVDAALAYTALTGTIYFLSMLSSYTLIKLISGDVFISKIGSVIFTLACVMNWFLLIGDAPYYNIDPVNNLIFPSHFASYILFPITLTLFIKYFLSGDKLFLSASIVSLVVITRFHPTWVVWAPIFLSGLIVFRNIFNRKFEIKVLVNYKYIFLIFLVSLMSGASFLMCKNTFPIDKALISPLDLWRVSGGNLLYFSEYLYLYDPWVYLKNRGGFDFITVALLLYLYKKVDRKQFASGFPVNGVQYNELLAIYLGALAVIALVIFNPVAVFLMIKVSGSSIPLYRTFVLMMPVLSLFTIYSVLALFKLKLGSKKFPLIAIGATILGGGIIISSNFDYLKKLYGNAEDYYSTSNSPYLEPFATLRTLGRGRVAIKASLATAMAALTDLDPITTERFRAKSLLDSETNQKENEALLLFEKSYDELLQIIKKRDIHYIVVSSADDKSVRNLKSHPGLVHFKSLAGSDEVWEINEAL